MIKKTCLLLLLFAVACGNQSLPGTKTQQETYRSIANEKLGDNVEFVPNELKNYLLCIKDVKGTQKNPDNDLKFLVYDLTADKISLELSVGSGTAKWVGTYEIEVFYKPGVMRKGETNDNYVTIYNLVTGEKRKKK